MNEDTKSKQDKVKELLVLLQDPNVQQYLMNLVRKASR